MGIHGFLVTLHFTTDKAGELGARQFFKPPLFQHIIDLAMLAAEVVEQVPLLGEHLAAGAAQLALEIRHTTESADCVSRSAEIILPPQFANDPTVLKSHY